jgi:hypothetical protein
MEVIRGSLRRKEFSRPARAQLNHAHAAQSLKRDWLRGQDLNLGEESVAIDRERVFLSTSEYPTQVWPRESNASSNPPTPEKVEKYVRGGGGWVDLSVLRCRNVARSVLDGRCTK